jgi:hypothetical protein
MDVPIDDEHPLTSGCKCGRTHGNAVEQTESHCAVCFGVMSRWSHGDEGDAFTQPLQGPDRFEAGPGSSAGGREGVRSGICIGIDVSTALAAETIELAEILGRVHPSQGFEVRLRRADVVDAVFEMEIAHSLHH